MWSIKNFGYLIFDNTNSSYCNSFYRMDYYPLEEPLSVESLYDKNIINFFLKLSVLYIKELKRVFIEEKLKKNLEIIRFNNNNIREWTLKLFNNGY